MSEIIYKGWYINPVAHGYYDAIKEGEEYYIWAYGLRQIKIEIDEYYE